MILLQVGEIISYTCSVTYSVCNVSEKYFWYLMLRTYWQKYVSLKDMTRIILHVYKLLFTYRTYDILFLIRH